MKSQNQYWQMKERFWSKNQGYRRIKQGSDGNMTKIGIPKVTDIDYNTLVTFIIIYV